MSVANERQPTVNSILGSITSAFNNTSKTVSPYTHYGVNTVSRLPTPNVKKSNWFSSASAPTPSKKQSWFSPSTPTSYTSAANSAATSSSFNGQKTGQYILRLLFWLLVYSTVLFIILVIVHYTVRPIFQFLPGGKGVIPIPAYTDDMVYWTAKKQPPAEDRVPVENDKLSGYPFGNSFSFSVDILVTKLTDQDVAARVILFKTFAYGTGFDGPGGSGTVSAPGTTENCPANSLTCPVCPVTPTKGSTLYGTPQDAPVGSSTVQTTGVYQCTSNGSFNGILSPLCDQGMSGPKGPIPTCSGNSTLSYDTKNQTWICLSNATKTPVPISSPATTIPPTPTFTPPGPKKKATLLSCKDTWYPNVLLPSSVSSKLTGMGGVAALGAYAPATECVWSNGHIAISYQSNRSVVYDVTKWTSTKNPADVKLWDESSTNMEGFANPITGAVPPPKIPSLVLPPMQDTKHTTGSLLSYMGKVSSMVLYLTETNDLVLTFFSGRNGQAYHSRPIRNVPLYKPFRISVVVEQKLFTMYLNGKQTFQRIFPDPIMINGAIKAINTSKQQRFYSRPAWSDATKATSTTPSKNQSVFLQNFHLWPRVLSYDEVVQAQPSLAAITDFGVDTKTDPKCSDVTTSQITSAFDLVPKV